MVILALEIFVLEMFLTDGDRSQIDHTPDRFPTMGPRSKT